MEQGNDLLYMLTPSGTSERSQPGAWASASSHLRKSQSLVTKTYKNQTPQEARPIVSKTKARQAKEVGWPTSRERWEVHRAKGNEEEFDKISMEETRNALNLPLHHIETNQKNLPI